MGEKYIRIGRKLQPMLNNYLRWSQSKFIVYTIVDVIVGMGISWSL